MEDNAELESFRRQWREEVARRTKHTKPNIPRPKPTTSSSTSVRPSQFPPIRHEASLRKEEDDEEGATSFGSTEIVQGVSNLSIVNDEDVFHSRESRKEPKSALEHFERAVEREAEGKLGDSLQHYRKAYKVGVAIRSNLCQSLLTAMLFSRCSWTQLSTRLTVTSTLPGRGKSQPKPQLLQRTYPQKINKLKVNLRFYRHLSLLHLLPTCPLLDQSLSSRVTPHPHAPSLTFHRR